MAAVEFQNVQDLRRQAVDTQVRTFFENNAPGYNAFKKNTEITEVTEKGYRIPYFSRRPGGHTGWIPSSSDFNAAVSPQTQSMYVFPVGYALPMQFTGALLRSFKDDSANAIASFNDLLKLYTETATKRLNRIFYGDGTGALAFSASTLGSTGSGQTMNCSTSAAATAGQTKGAKYLEAGHTYQAINTSTGAVRGTIVIETEGATSATVNVTSGTVTSGDPIVDVGSYNRYMRGLAKLISDQTDDLQGLSRSTFPDLKSSVIDLNGGRFTPVTLETLKATLHTRHNSADARSGLLFFITPGLLSTLRAQGYGLRQYIGDDTVKGVSQKYEDGDSVFIEDADMDDDRVYAVKSENMRQFEEMPFGEYNLDSQEFRMLLGANNTGSDNYQKAIGCRANPGMLWPRSAAFVKRSDLTGVVRSTSV